jgi:hypothetical protein
MTIFFNPYVFDAARASDYCLRPRVEIPTPLN